MRTSEGDIKINLFDDETPETVANFLGLATGEKEWIDPMTGQPSHEPFYNTIFGEVADDDSKAVVDKLEAVNTDRMDRPTEPVGIVSVEVLK